jgi:hypothetical protein
MGGACGTHGRDEKCIQNFGGETHVGKISLGRPKRRWKDIITMYLREIGWEDVGWLHKAQGRDQ